MYINLLTQLKNAQAVKKDAVKMPYSKNKEKILDILAAQKYVAEFEKKGRNPKRILNIKLAYQDGAGVINGIKFISTPSRHIYAGYKEIRLVKSGYGTLVVSTSRGIMTGQEARKKKLGGELLFEIW